MDRIFGHVGKKVRRQNFDQVRLNERAISLIADTISERTISDINARIEEAARNDGYFPVEDAVNMIANLQNSRHNLWVELLEKHKSRPTLRFNDIRIRDFINDLRATYGIEVDPLPFGHEINKSPDIIMYMERERVIFIGDVAVSDNYEGRNRDKFNHYAAVARCFREQGIEVIQDNFIVKTQLDNVSSLLRKYREYGVIGEDTGDVPKATHYTQVATRDIERVKNRCTSRQELMRVLATLNNVPIQEVLEIPDVAIDSNPVEPSRTEEEIINWIKIETERLDHRTYYDMDLEQSLKAFDTIVEENSKREKMEPKSTLMAVSNCDTYESLSGHELIEDYVKDLQTVHLVEGGDETLDTIKYIMDLLPNRVQIDRMKEIYKGNRKEVDKGNRVYGSFQYERSKSNNFMTMNLNYNLQKGKVIKNEKVEPATIDTGDYQSCINFINNSVNYYGSHSNKTPLISTEWTSSTLHEANTSSNMKTIFDYVRSTNGAQLAQSMSHLYNRLSHLKTKEGSHDNVFVPPNGAFIAVIPKEHAPVSSRNCDIPAIFICRYLKGRASEHNEYERKVTTDKYVYYISKLCRFNMNKISNWDQCAHKLIGCSTYIMNRCPELFEERRRVVGTLTYYVLDIHQKTSEFLEVLKYSSFQPFSEVHRLSSFILDKLNLHIKTQLDVWNLMKIKDFIVRLSDRDKLNAKKPKLMKHNGMMTRESKGVMMSLPSFLAENKRIDSPEAFIEEVNICFIMRPKHLYGSQFMDKSTDMTVDVNVKYCHELTKHGDWVDNGRPNNPDDSFPFDAKFAYSEDAIIYAQRYFEENVPVNTQKISNNLSKESINGYMHYNCSLRGATKERSDRRQKNDLHSTSMNEVLKYYEKKSWRPEECTAMAIANENIINWNNPFEFCMSEKDQRGGGRPIATPTISTKATLMMIEKPEAAIGKEVGNNIIVSGKNKLTEQHNAYVNLVADGSASGYSKLYQAAEDQTKFSEMDNWKKYRVYLKNSNILDRRLRRFQLACLEKMGNRIHYTKTIPRSVREDPEKAVYINDEGNGVKAIMGWPQGMLNFISTSIHSLADYWIVHAYNIAYPENKVMTTGLVHSDDSWIAVACNDLNDFKRFCLFRMLAKRMFCLKLNEKKFWGSSYMGELVSNYNINGNVHLSIPKSFANAFNNLLYQNWVLDVNNQISSIQQCYRNGADIPTLILLHTLLKDQIVTSYRVNGIQHELMHVLPVELGGYPSSSVFELATTGLQCFYHSLYDMYRLRPNERPSIIVGRAIKLSIMSNNGIILSNNMRFFESNKDQSRYVGKKHVFDQDGQLSTYTTEDEYGDEVVVAVGLADYESSNIAGRGDVFKCIKHLMPKPRRLAETIARIRSLPFEGNGMGMIITKPVEIEVALGNLKEQTSTMLYDLAADHYTQSARRLAVSQAIQSSGKTVKIGELRPMTFNELLEFLLKIDNVNMAPFIHMVSSFVDNDDIPSMARSIVYNAEYVKIPTDKRKQNNRRPDEMSRYTTVSPLKDVLLRIIDMANNTNYYLKYARSDNSPDILAMDIRNIRQRFVHLFETYNTVYACSLIIQQYWSGSTSKLWVQPHLKTDSLEAFLSDLYGKTVSDVDNYKVILDVTYTRPKCEDSKVVDTLYTAEVLNKMYDGKFQIMNINGKTRGEVLEGIDMFSLPQNTQAKFSILHYLEFKDPRVFNEYKNINTYDHFWIKEQKYDKVAKRWIGGFEVMVMNNGVILHIIKNDNGTKVRTNSNDAYGIMVAMKMFVDTCFKHKVYKTPTRWADCDLWNRSDLIHGKTFLCYYGNTTSVIQNTRTHVCLPLDIDKRLRWRFARIRCEVGEIELGHYLRTVSRVQNGKKQRILSVQQNLNCPLSTQCNFIPDTVNGLDNNKLFEYGLIVDLTVGRFGSLSKSNIKDLLANRVGHIPMDLVYDTHYAIVNYLARHRYIPEEIDETIEYNIENVEDVEIAGIAAETFADRFVNVQPEDLTFVEADFACELNEEVITKFSVHSNIIKSLCRAFHSRLNDDDALDIIRISLYHSDYVKLLIEDKAKIVEDNIDEEYFNACRDACEYIEPSEELLYLLYGFGMNNTDRLSEMGIDRIFRDKDRTLRSNECTFLGEEYVRLVTSEINDIAVPDSWEDLLD